MVHKYKEDLEIDEHNLHEELKWQPSLYMKWSELYSEAVHSRDRQKEKTEVLYAQLDEAVRIAPEAYDIQRVTESAIKSVVIQLPEYRKQIRELHKRTKEVNVLMSARESMRHKKDVLQNMVMLYLNNYYADMPIPDKLKDEAGKQTDRAVAQSLKKSKRLRRLKR